MCPTGHEYPPDFPSPMMYLKRIQTKLRKNLKQLPMAKMVTNSNNENLSRKRVMENLRQFQIS